MSGTAREMVHGLVAADGLAWQNLYRRARVLPAWTRRKRREIEAEHEAHGILDEALPFALNQPTAPFRTGPGANSEWVAFQVQVLLAGGGRYERERAVATWRELAPKRDTLRLTVGQHAALRNLASGASPPTSGHDNPHYFDDSACFRAVALVLGDGSDLAARVESDAQISNAHDGVWAARAFAVALRSALDDAACRAAIHAARACIPEGSWLAIEVERAMELAEGASNLYGLIASLADEGTNHAYDYGNSAPETLAIALAILHVAEGELQPSLLAALALPRTAASVAPMVGALCGALGSIRAGELPDPGPLRGLALPHLAGLRPLDLLEGLSTTS